MSTNSNPSSASFPSFDASIASFSPTQFLEFMNNLVAHNLDTPSKTLESNSLLWVTVVSGLSEQFLACFPAPDKTRWRWRAMQEKVLLAQAALKIVRFIAQRIQIIFYGTDGEVLSTKLFLRLFNFCHVMDGWRDVSEDQGMDIGDLPTPQALADEALETTVKLLRTFGGMVAHLSESSEPLWKTLRHIMEKCLLAVRNSIERTTVSTFPMSINLFALQEGATDNNDMDDKSLTLTLDSVDTFPNFLSTTLHVVTHTVCPAVKTQWFLGDRIRQLSSSVAFAFEYCLSPLCLAVEEKRAAALVKLAGLATLLETVLPAESRAPDLRLRILRYRLEEPALSGWEDADRELTKMSVKLPSRPDLAEVLRLEAWEQMPSSLQMTPDLLQLTRQRFDALQLSQDHTSLLYALDDRLHVLSSDTDESADGDWRSKVADTVKGIIKPLGLYWMDDGDTLPEGEYAQRALEEVRRRFERRLEFQDTSSRVMVADKLSSLVCTVSKCAGSSHSKRLKLSALPAGLTAVARLLDGSTEEVTSAVRRRSYALLSKTIRHHASTDRDGLDHAATTILRGLDDPDRSVRLNVGSALAALIELCAQEADSADWYLVFSRACEVLESATIAVKETLIITFGVIARIQSSQVLSHALCILFNEVGSSHLVLRGTACMQILNVAQHYNKTVMALTLPHFDRLAPLLVSRIGTQPQLLYEASRLMQHNPEAFLSLTLPKTLPTLFGQCEVKVIQLIAKSVRSKPSSLFLNHAAEILAHIFMLRGVDQTHKAIDSLLNILMESTNLGEIDAQSVVKSSIVQLIAELVTNMGDENADTAQYAITALKKVENIMAPENPSPDLSNFLKAYMLGVITYVSELLRDGRGKLSLIMATFQSTLGVPELSDVTLDSWYTFFRTPEPHDVGPHVGPTSAAFVSAWSSLSATGRDLATRTLEYIVMNIGSQLGAYLDEVADLTPPELDNVRVKLKEMRSEWSAREELQKILDRVWSDNLTMVAQSLKELKTFMLSDHKDFVTSLASGDVFDPLVGKILSALFAAACREGDGTEGLRLLAFECIGGIGAVDPDRFELGPGGPAMIVLSNFTNEEDSIAFALHLVKDLLVGAFRSTSDIRYQSQLAYCIQELCKFCRFTPALVSTGSSSGSTSVPIKVRNRWNALPKHVVETAAPLLEGRFAVPAIAPMQSMAHPIYPEHSTYREWIQWWSLHLITIASGATAQRIFGVFRQAVRNKDVVVAHHLLPHLVLNILISGKEDDTQNIRKEILAVLEDQIDPASTSSDDKKLLSAQVVFTLLDHLNKWVRLVRQELGAKKSERRARASANSNAQMSEQLMRVDSILSSIDENLMARAALKCKSYARSLMNFERQIMTLRQRAPASKDLPGYYERLHEIYSFIDEPDGMEGVSTLILSPSLEHQIREHESTGRWTSAQSCWEVRLQQAPDSLEYHLGLLRCLRNLGHYDTLRTHVRGVLTRNPEWQPVLAGFQVESAWIVGAWTDVQDILEQTTVSTSPSVAMSRVLLAMRSRDSAAISTSLAAARTILGAPITASSGARGYRRSYEAVLDLHVANELEMIYNDLTTPGSSQSSRKTLKKLNVVLSSRLESTLPTFRTREPVLSMRRTAFGLITTHRQHSIREIGRSWLASAKIARNAGQWQTAYSAVLQSQQSKAEFSFMESAKLVKATGEPLRALQEIENAMKLLGIPMSGSVQGNVVLDLTEDDPETSRMKAKAQILRAKWMNESDRYDSQSIFNAFLAATELQPDWESSHFHLGQFHDECFKDLPPADKISRGIRMNASTIKSFTRAIKYGSKYVYQTVPRLITIWLDLGEDRKTNTQETYKRLNDTIILKAIRDTPAYKWYTAFPQIVSRVGHDNPEVYKVLSSLIIRVLQEYPKQALWLFTSVVKSTKSTRAARGKEILEKLVHFIQQAGHRSQTSQLVKQCTSMTNQLLKLCDHPVSDEARGLSMQQKFPELFQLGTSQLIIPLQESLTASLPPSSAVDESTHQPFDLDVPTFQGFSDEIEIMRSLAKPRKITIHGSNGQIYMFLGKPKDDLRKDARLMDFNSIINKLLKANSESRRRQLHIRTYGVVTLNEECGFIQWVPNTIPLRPVLLKGYDGRGIKSWSTELSETFAKIKTAKDKQAAELFRDNVLAGFPPVFHEWFIETFPEPSAWLASRMAYGRTAAVMSMVGYILGLGDRHCENILLDVNTGDVVHVDFNCLFEKGKSLETPERVPFRLTQNMVDGLGVTGVEGVFRLACEVTMQLLHDNKDSLMSVLDAFIHDPLVEWEDEKRRQSRNGVKASANLKSLAKNALDPIERKLKGLQDNNKVVSTSNVVQKLIQEATDAANLAKMYPGWASWH
ncbi:unnamed protein product [Mycena citricolor]|uniref:non-specific serine/threonine protein kinase n=1 Tax=Mycena citricolor TaxID=2018698 RepID=A0AAD2Q529_9AGAR|nr:unnamed protein product [Mycena citricolor]